MFPPAPLPPADPAIRAGTSARGAARPTLHRLNNSPVAYNQIHTIAASFLVDRSHARFLALPSEGGDRRAIALTMKSLARLALLALLGSATVLVAQPAAGSGHGPRGGKGPGGPGGHRGGNPVVRALDADKNGELSAAEITGASAALKALDTDADGAVSTAELRGNRPGRPAGSTTPPADRPARPEGAGSRPLDPVMLALDANSDHALSAAEIANASASLKALDANSDGKLTRDELHPLPPAK